MSKEIFTTANMNEIVTPIHEAMSEGNPVAKLVFDLNDAIRALKPGRPISKQERDNLEFMLDNIIVGLANDSMGIGAHLNGILEDPKKAFKNDSFESVIVKWYEAKQEMLKNIADKAAKKELDKYPSASKLVILDGLTNLIKTMSTKDISNSIEVPEELIIAVIRREDGAEDAFFKELKPVNSITLVTASNFANDVNEDESCDDAEGNDDNMSDFEKELIDTLRNALEASKAAECKYRKHIRPVICKSKEAGDLFEAMLKHIMDM